MYIATCLHNIMSHTCFLLFIQNLRKYFATNFLTCSYFINCHYNIIICMPITIFMSRSLLWKHIVLLTVGIYSSNHRVLYTIGISMTRKFQKKCRSVRLSVCNANKKSLLLHYSRIIIRISDERVWHPLQENEAIFSKNYFSKILERIFEKLRICTKMPAPPSLLTVE